jgi:hypothetical protein
MWVCAQPCGFAGVAGSRVSSRFAWPCDPGATPASGRDPGSKRSRLTVSAAPSHTRTRRAQRTSTGCAARCSWTNGVETSVGEGRS